MPYDKAVMHAATAVYIGQSNPCNKGQQYIMPFRQNALQNWLSDTLKGAAFQLKPLTGDASFRRYFRLYSGISSYIVMDAPPDRETIVPFIEKAAMLKAVAIHTPAILASEPTQGFLLLEDFGDTAFLHHVNASNADRLYGAATQLLQQIQTISCTALPRFDHDEIMRELQLFTHWFVQQHLGIGVTKQEHELLHSTFTWISQALLQQPQVFVHRDYHSRNLMILPHTTELALGVLDFQDAVAGPLTYDLVSILKDCYVQWRPEQIAGWRDQFYHQLPPQYAGSLADFAQGFELCGLQRHLKILGIFCRLYLRDGKAQYLKDLPLTYHYVSSSSQQIPALASFFEWLQTRIYPRFIEVSNPCILQ